MRYHKQKRDASEAAIVAALRAAGATVYLLDHPCDALCGLGGSTFIHEYKTGRGKLNANQEKFIAEWRGSPVIVLRNVDEALAWLSQAKEAA